MNNFSAISWREQVTFQWDDDHVCFVLDQRYNWNIVESGILYLNVVFQICSRDFQWLCLYAHSIIFDLMNFPQGEFSRKNNY